MYLDNLAELLDIKCELLIDPENEAAQRMKAVQEYFLDQQKPQRFDPHGENVLMAEEARFEEICNVMEDSGSHDVKNCTEFVFYGKIQFYEKKYKAMKAAGAGDI